MFHMVALLMFADKAINHSMLLYPHIWHQQSDQFELKLYCMSQVMSCSVHKYVFSQAICQLLPMQLLSFCQHGSAQQFVCPSDHLHQTHLHVRDAPHTSHAVCFLQAWTSPPFRAWKRRSQQPHKPWSNTQQTRTAPRAPACVTFSQQQA